MADRVLIPFGPEILVLTAEEFEIARQRGRSMAAPPITTSPAPPGTELVTASALALELSLPKSCIYEYAKAGRIPCVRVGKHVRFNAATVLAALGSTGAVTGGHR